MTQRRKRYDRQFKVSAAKVVLSGEMTVKDLSEELGIKDSTLRRWACEYEETGDDAFPGNGSPKIDKDHEIAKLKKKVEPGDPRLNLAERAFAVGGRNRLRAGGIAYMPASEGRLCLAAAIDAFSRKAAGWSMSERRRSAGRTRQTTAASSSMTTKARSTPRAPSRDAWTRMA